MFIFVQVMFAADRATAANAAPLLFYTFEIYQLGLFVVAIVAVTAWRMVVCSRSKRWISRLIILAGALAIVQTAFVSTRMRAMMTGEQRGGSDFRRLHSYSMILYASQTVILAAAACLLPAAISGDARRNPVAGPPRERLPQTPPV